MIGVAIGTVKSRTSRARKRLAELMGLDQGEEVTSPADRATQAVMSTSGHLVA